MQALLDLLLSEDRNDRLKSEQQRIKEYIKEPLLHFCKLFCHIILLV